MIDDVLDVLGCPHCGDELTRLDQVLGCAAGHRFDVARHGHVALLGPRSRTDTGDSTEMVAARVAFLAGGHYAPIADLLALLATPGGAGPLLVEVGAGTGYYLASVLDRLDARGVAIDSSVRAARRAAGAHPRLGSVVADAWSALPVRDAVADLVISVFAPRNPAEFRRIVRPDGALLIVTPEPDHLQELIEPFGMLSVDAEKPARLTQSLTRFFTRELSLPLRFEMHLQPGQVADLVLMGPAARHLDRTAFAAAVDRLPALTSVTASVTVGRWLPA